MSQPDGNAIGYARRATGMTDDPIRAAYEEWTQGRDPVSARIALFEHVRDLPFRYPPRATGGRC
jgi:hypothetical protein